MPEIIKKQLLYTVPETRELLRVDGSKVYEYISEGMLPAMRIGKGRELLIRYVSIMRFLDKYDGYDLSNLNDIKPVSVLYFQRCSTENA